MLSGNKQADAMAAAWLARLQSDAPTQQDLELFRAWLAEKEEHRHAFERANTAWEMAGGAGNTYLPSSDVRPAFSRRAVMAGSFGIAAIASTIGLRLWSMGPTIYETGIGEQRRVILADGTALLLDTATRLSVDLKDEWRRVKLISGRAHFDVAHDARRPFIVEAYNRRVIAIGTAFDVSKSADSIEVTLIEGKVVVQPLVNGMIDGARLLSPGERVVYRKSRLERFDHPSADQLAGWQTGLLVFDNEPLAAAIESINRYSKKPLILADPAIGERRISGSYTAAEAERFAQSVSLLLGLQADVESDRIVLSTPQAPPV